MRPVSVLTSLIRFFSSRKNGLFVVICLGLSWQLKVALYRLSPKTVVTTEGQAITTGVALETFRVAQNASVRNNSTILVWIVNYDPEFYYSVMAEVPDRYTRAAIQTNNNSDPKYDSNGQPVIEFKLQPLFDGEYQLRVQKIMPGLEARKGPTPLVMPSPEYKNKKDITVSVSRPILPRVRSPSVNSLVPCQSVHQSGLVPWYGEWIGPGDTRASLGKIRTGWAFAPTTCSIETFSIDDLSRIAHSTTTPKTIIAVIGTSRERGVFLSMVDMALYEEEKSELETSKTGKCWGRTSIQVGDKLQFIYQDLRTQLIDPNEQPGTVICHGEIEGQGSGYYGNTTRMIKELFRVPAERPTVVMLWSGCYFRRCGNNCQNPPPACAVATKDLLQSFPRDWKGTIYISNIYIAADTPQIHEAEYNGYLSHLEWMQQYLGDGDTRVRVLDLYRLTADMRLAAERPGMIQGSTHHHRWCNESGMVVCSNVTEVLANLMIARAVAPEGKAKLMSEMQQATPVATTRRLEVCTDCPKALTPYHVIPVPNLECVGSFVASDQAGAAWGAPACPAECLKSEPVGEQSTQSGPVPVRKCVLAVNTTA